jgi:hypothetical protein
MRVQPSEYYNIYYIGTPEASKAQRPIWKQFCQACMHKSNDLVPNDETSTPKHEPEHEQTVG